MTAVYDAYAVDVDVAAGTDGGVECCVVLCSRTFNYSSLFRERP